MVLTPLRQRARRQGARSGLAGTCAVSAGDLNHGREATHRARRRVEQPRQKRPPTAGQSAG